MTDELARAADIGAHRHLVVSDRLRGRRRELGLTQKEVVARLRRLGVTTTNKALSSLEHGAGLDVAKLPELARALECTLTYLLGLTRDPSSWEPDSEQWPARGAVPVTRTMPNGTPATPGANGAANGVVSSVVNGRLDPRILGPLQR